MEILYIAMWILQGHLYGRTRTVQVKSGMSIDSHPESYVLVQTASPYSPGKYVNWNLSFFNGDPAIIAMWILQSHLYGRTRTVQVKSGMSIDSHPESYVLVQTASPYSPGKYVNWNLSFFNGDPVYSYGEFFKVTCTAVQELYRSSLVCPLILIRRATFWSKRQSPYSPGKYVNWNLSFFNGDPVYTCKTDVL